MAGFRNSLPFDKLAKKITANNLPLIGNEIVADIVERTQSGFDKDGKSFDKYDPKTIKRKGSSIVNLKDSFKMLKNVKWKKIKDGIRLYVGGSRTKGLTNNDVAYYNKKMGREFLGVDPKQSDKITKELIKLSKK